MENSENPESINNLPESQRNEGKVSTATAFRVSFNSKIYSA